MKVSEAEKLVCPFIAQMGEDGSGFTVFSKHSECITTKCMAWMSSKTKDIKYFNENASSKEKEGYSEVNCDDGICKWIEWHKDLEPQDCEGYCQRIGNE